MSTMASSSAPGFELYSEELNHLHTVREDQRKNLKRALLWSSMSHLSLITILLLIALAQRNAPRNERVVVRMETAAHGAVAVVLVGAANVGRIGLAFADLITNVGRAAGETRPASKVELRRGDELGVFNLGSTVVLLLASPRLEPGPRSGSLVRVGEALFRPGPGSNLA